MKAFTDIEQSKQLAKILPIESADMCFYNDGTAIKIDANSYTVRYSMWKDCVVEIIPCWSLAALLDLLPEQSNLSKRYAEDCETMTYWIWISSFDYESEEYTNPIDACMEIIVELKEKNLL